MSRKNKADIISAVHENTDYSKQVIEDITDELFIAISEALVDGGEVRITEFATFRVITRKGHTGRNPRTGEPMWVQPNKQIKASFSAPLKRLVSEN